VVVPLPDFFYYRDHDSGSNLRVEFTAILYVLFCGLTGLANPRIGIWRGGYDRAKRLTHVPDRRLFSNSFLFCFIAATLSWKRCVELLVFEVRGFFLLVAAPGTSGHLAREHFSGLIHHDISPRHRYAFPLRLRTVPFVALLGRT